MKILGQLFTVICVFFLLSCEYEESPWTTSTDCSRNVSVAYNIERLKQQEAAEGPRSSYKVALVADPQLWPGRFEDLIHRFNKMDDVAYVILSGDLAHNGLSAEFEWTCKGMSASKKPIFAVIGNHDSLAFGADIWLKYLGEYNYSFTYQDTKIVAYNDNKYEFENVPDRAWLADEINGADTRAHTIAVSHIPPWPTDRGLSKYLKDLGVELTIHGHESNFDYRQYGDTLLPHYVTSMSRKNEYGILTVTADDLILENCTGSVCEEAELVTIYN